MLISPSNSSAGCLAKQSVNEPNLQQYPDKAGRRDRRLQQKLAKGPQFAAISRLMRPPGDRAIPESSVAARHIQCYRELQWSVANEDEDRGNILLSRSCLHVGRKHEYLLGFGGSSQLNFVVETPQHSIKSSNMVFGAPLDDARCPGDADKLASQCPGVLQFLWNGSNQILECKGLKSA
jgi:hypothetical protein